MKTFWIIFTCGIFLRIFLSLTTYHSDMGVFDLAGKLVAGGNLLNLYDFSSNSAVFNYPPAIYLLHGVFSFLFNFVGFSNIYQLNINLFLLKIPYLFFDLGIAFILVKLFESPKQKILAFSLWMFNPINLYATYMMGQFDVIPTFFAILSLFMATKNRLELAALSLGAGIAFKIWPVFLVIPFLILGKNYFGKIKLLVLSLVPYSVSIIPFISSYSFRSTALLANQSSKSFYAAIPVSGGESIILFPVILLSFYLYIWHLKPETVLWKLFIIPLLLFFVFTHYHPQWLIWLTPFLILGMLTSTTKKITIPTLLIFGSWVVSLFFFDPSLTIGIFSPAFGFQQNTPRVWQLLNVNPDYNISRSLIQTVFAAASFYLIYLYFPKKAHA